MSTTTKKQTTKSKNDSKPVAELPEEPKNDKPKSRKATQMSMLEHMKSKSMWVGSQSMQTISSYVLTTVTDPDDEAAEYKKFELADLRYPPALLKIIDEVIVNAIDHHTHFPKLVDTIKISCEPNGSICIYNNGPGIPVELTKNAAGVEMYVPQLIASEFFAGDNLLDAGDNIKGGTNGIGLKAAAAWSTLLELETADSTNGLIYKQVFSLGLTKIETPTITKMAKTVKPYTKITFVPDYAKFKIKIDTFYPTLVKLLETRAWQAAAYTKATVHFNNLRIPVKSFKEFCEMFTTNVILETHMTRTTAKGQDYIWDVCFAVSDGKEQHLSIVNGVYIPKGGTHIDYIQKQLVEKLKPTVEKELKKSGVKFNKNYITNNVFIFMKGSIPSPEFLSQTKEAISDPIDKFANYDLTESEWKAVWNLLANPVLSMFLQKQLGDVKTRATRTKIEVPKYKEAKYCRDSKNCHKCGLIITEGDSASGTADTGLLDKGTGDAFSYDWYGVFSIGGVPMNGLKESTEIATLVGNKLVKASKASSKNAKSGKKSTKSKNSILDDDIISVSSGSKSHLDGSTTDLDDVSPDDLDIDDSTTDLDTDDNLSGSTTDLDSGTKSSKSNKTNLDHFLSNKKFTLGKRMPNAKLIKNERISSLVKVLGLDYKKSYELNAKGDAEFKTLRYGFVVGLTDQDLDGFNIFGLVVTFLMTYWPALLARGFIRRIVTPVIRAFPKSKKNYVMEFYTEAQYQKWLETNAANAANSVSTDVKGKYTIKYYKGLGSHQYRNGEVTQMFKNIDTKMRTYTVDDQAIENMNIYYGKETLNRKVALADPKIIPMIDSQMVPISQQFCIDTKLYQRDNIIRKLLNAIDGFVTSRRKVFFAARKHGINNKETIKVQGLAGKAVAEANYHHGEASLEQTIIRMAQAFPMARNLPLLQPHGNFGTRSKGYKDAAASRYIYTIINHKLADALFRREDEYILQYEIDDGVRYEPKYYMPIVPYVLLENNQLPATGWTIDVHARDINAVFKNIRDMINGKIKTCGKLPFWNNGFKGSIREYKGKQYYVGVYQWIPKENAIHITELPPGIYSDSYVRGPEQSIRKATEEKRGIRTKEYVLDVDDNTTFESVDIKIYLKPGTFDLIAGDDSKYGNEVFDPIEDYFELTESINHHINLVNEHGEVVEYSSYEDVFNDWFKFRKNLYGVRVDREIILSKLEIIMLQNMQRFSKLHDSYKITNKTTEEETISILAANKYSVINHTVLENPRFTSVTELHALITEEKHGASYDYLLRLAYRDLTATASEKRDARILQLEERLKYLSDETGLFKGAKIWLHELDELENAIDIGIKTDWFYGENKVRFK